jgi:uncharacterized protein (DUF488 family)
MKFVTIGVYGYSEDDFFTSLSNTGITVFCDIRARRGMRGSQYSFVNATYLQNKLAELGIKYVHFKELAPTTAIRQQQAIHDELGAGKRNRLTLSKEFIAMYQEEKLADFDSTDFIRHFDDTDTVCLFCVERLPQACHRSVVANKLVSDLKVQIEHIQ